MAAIISEKFRIFNAKQFLESLSEGTGDLDADRSRMYFFVGRPQDWKTYIETYNKSTTDFTVGETITNGSGFSGTVSEVYPNSLLVTDVLSASSLTAGDTITGGGSGATASVGVYRFATEDIPTAPFDNQAEKYDIYDDLIAAKRITDSYARHVVRRYNWNLTANPKFDMWRPDYNSQNLTATGAASLGDGKYAVLNQSTYEVFVCLYNGTVPSDPAKVNGQDATYAPTKNPVAGQGTYANGIFSETDGSGNVLAGTAGYVWKYMYTIPTDDVIRFLSTDFMPIVLDGTVQTGAVDGQISAVLLRSAGANLSTSATLYAAIIGDGTGGKVKILTNGAGQITSVSVYDGGSGYTYGNVVIQNGFIFTDDALTSAASLVDPRGDIEVVIPPQGGHGSDPVIEMNSKRVMLNVRLTYSEGAGDFPVDNDFRRIGLLQDPLEWTGSNYYAAETGSLLYAVKVTGATATDFIPDESITQTNGGDIAKGKVVSWTLDVASTTDGVLKYYQSPSEHTHNGEVLPFTATGAIVGAASGASKTVDNTFSGQALGKNFNSGLAYPEIKNNSGELIYVENRRLITRAADQIEDIKLVIEF